MATRTRFDGGYVNGVRERVDLYVLDCANCGVVFAITTDYENRRRDDGQSFRCPNGHLNCWSDTAEKRLKKERDRLKEQLEIARISRQAAQDQADTAERRRRAAKGQLTKVKKRIANGVCPCCNRTFPNLADHMETKHPDYSPSAAVPAADETTA